MVLQVLAQKDAVTHSSIAYDYLLCVQCLHDGGEYDGACDYDISPLRRQTGYSPSIFQFHAVQIPEQTFDLISLQSLLLGDSRSVLSHPLM